MAAQGAMMRAQTELLPLPLPPLLFLLSLFLLLLSLLSCLPDILMVMGFLFVTGGDDCFPFCLSMVACSLLPEPRAI